MSNSRPADPGSGGALVTHGRTQYAAYFDADGFMVVAQRPLGIDSWKTRRSGFRRNGSAEPAAVSLAVDEADFLHVAWAHRDSPLQHARAIAPGSLEMAASAVLTDAIAQPRDPQFCRRSDGDLLLIYGDRGSLMAQRYVTASNAWGKAPFELLRGQSEERVNWTCHVGRDGTLHLAWTWRARADGTPPQVGLSYVRSRDGGDTWTSVDRAVFALPLNAAAVGPVQRFPADGTLLPTPVIDSTRRGEPYLGAFWAASSSTPPRFHLFREEAGAWRSIPGPAIERSFSGAGLELQSASVHRAAIFIDETWKKPALHLIFRDAACDGRIVVATGEGHTPTTWSTRVLCAASPNGWPLTIDPMLWPRLTQVHLLVPSNAPVNGGADSRAAGADSSAIGTLIWTTATDHMRSPSSTSAAIPNSVTEPPLVASTVLSLAQRAADWQWANFPEVAMRHPRAWEIAPFYLGVLALDRISPDGRNREQMLKKAEEIGWQPHERIYHADDQCVIQAYYELHQLYAEPRMIAASRKRFDRILSSPTKARFDWGEPGHLDRWSWCDALFMAPVAWLQTWKETGDVRYLEFMNREWWITTARLYRPDVGFYFRDESYLDLREPNGATIHWSRGNSWVFAGLARVLDLFPREHPDYPRYVKLYQEMAAAVIATQQPDGFWRPGLLDPVAHPARESSGTSFFAFGLAWGVNRGLLDRTATEPAVRRAWHALASCVTPEGKLEYVQPIGGAPEGFDPHHTDVFAVGAFLLAASEVFPLGGPDGPRRDAR